jgi:hypothetical protein
MSSYIIFICLLISVISHNVTCLIKLDPLVETKLGLVRGLRATDGAYTMFMGIPFGEVDESNAFAVSQITEELHLAPFYIPLFFSYPYPTLGRYNMLFILL